MIRLEDIKPGLPLTGLDSAVIGSVVAVVPIAEGTVRRHILAHSRKITIRQFQNLRAVESTQAQVAPVFSESSHKHNFAFLFQELRSF